MSLNARPNRTPVRSGEDAATEPAAAVERGSIGETLRTRREQLGWALPDIAQWLRIRLPYLEALEAGRFSELPGTAYAIGFLKTYAQALGFDAEDMARRFGQETAGRMAPKPELTFPSPKPERGVPLSVWTAAGLVLVIAAYALWYRTSAHQVTPSEHVPPVAEVMPGVTSQGTASPQVASVLPGPGHAPSAIVVPQQASKPVVAAPSTPPSTGASTGAQVPAPQPVASQPVVGQTPPAVQPPVQTKPDVVAPAQQPVQPSAQPPIAPTPEPTPAVPAPTPDAATGVLVFHATADSWLAVRDAQNHVLVQRVLKAGESWSPPAGADVQSVYRVTVGNAGGVSVSSGSVMSAVLGHNGAVARGLMISGQAVLDGKFGHAAAALAQ